MAEGRGGEVGPAIVRSFEMYVRSRNEGCDQGFVRLGLIEIQDSARLGFSEIQGSMGLGFSEILGSVRCRSLERYVRPQNEGCVGGSV